MSVLVALGVGLGSFIAGVIFSEKVKAWFKVKSADAVATVKRDVAAEVTKVEAKL